MYENAIPAALPMTWYFRHKEEVGLEFKAKYNVAEVIFAATVDQISGFIQQLSPMLDLAAKRWISGL